jgi:DNA-binding NarL/FixJ family response regulator
MTEGAGEPLRIVALEVPEKEKIIESFRLGARGIILKTSPARIWRRGIAAVLAGQYWLGNESLEVLVQAIRDLPTRVNSIPAHFGLTPREIEIVQKIADGRSNKEVGEDCSIRERTVKHHLTNIFGKVGVSSRLELALFARDNAILAGANVRESAGTGDLGEPSVQSETSLAENTSEAFGVEK